MTERYRFYRVHKFLVAYINDVSRLIAKSDFTNDEDLRRVRKEVDDLIKLMHDHADYEDKAFHTLAAAKGSNVHKNIETDHQKHGEIFTNWCDCLDDIANEEDLNTRITKGYQFYLTFRAFEADNLRHLNDEENMLMPELQRLYSDEALEAVAAATYQKDVMTPEIMLSMLKTIFPYVDRHDRLAFLEDIHKAAPEKFSSVFENILKETDCDGKKLIDDNEKAFLAKHFSATHASLT